MRDISAALVKVIEDKKCSPLLAFIEVKDGIYLQESEPDAEPSRRLRDSGNINIDRKTVGIHLHGHSNTGV